MANIAEKVYRLDPNQATETVLAKMKRIHIYYINVDSEWRWRMWHKKTKTLKFKKGGKISFTNGWMNQQYNW